MSTGARAEIAWNEGTATGGLINTTISFMPLRDQRIARAAVAEVVRDTDIPVRSDTDLHASLCNDHGALFTIGLEVPGCHWQYEPATGDDDRWCVWFLDPSSRSWARFDHQPGLHRWPVHQSGPRRLFGEIAAAYHWWDHAGRPRPPSGASPSPVRQRVELTGITHDTERQQT